MHGRNTLHGWSELQTRRLLRKLHTPGQVDDDPTAVLLATTLNAASPREATEYIAKRALHPYPGLYWMLIRRMEIEGAKLGDVIDELDYSHRTIYRYRAHAIKAIAREIERALNQARDGAALQPLPPMS